VSKNDEIKQAVMALRPTDIGASDPVQAGACESCRTPASKDEPLHSLWLGKLVGARLCRACTEQAGHIVNAESSVVANVRANAPDKVTA
jgi:uncharacterized NAD(P)/FAD-binding protein YdhS